MFNEINELALSGQFDNVDEELIEEIVKSDDEYYENEYEDDSKYIKNLNFKDDIKYTTNCSQWTDKMDFRKVKSTSKATDKSDNATFDRVLDDRSLKIMFKMMRQNLFNAVKGTISAGKEANVYYAPTADGQDYVLKVYMTSIMPFRARDKYMNGDFRFKNANLSSSTKLVTTWAEKEFRNLIRINETNGAIPCPKPIKQKGMVLVMTMIGTLGDAAPKLKDIVLDSEEEWSLLYEQILGYVRILFQECRLIHADLSEYNLLYYLGKIWMIDVSQSVEHFHPEALNFLRKDCNIMNTFFRSKGIKTLSLSEFFDFVVDPTICKHTDDNFHSFIHELVNKSEYYMNNEEDLYFLQCHIPRTLSDVGKFVEDYKKLRKDPNYLSNCPYAPLTGMKEELKDIRSNLKKSCKKHKLNLKIMKEQLRLEEEDEKQECEEEIDNVDSRHEKNHAEETKEEKKLRKKQVKENQRNKRIENKNEIIAEKARTIRGFKARNIKQ